jgi:hypothetical protein
LADRALFFGCWNQPGHYLFAPGRGSPTAQEERMFSFFSGGVCLDANYAPRRGIRGKLRGVEVCFAGQGATIEDRQRIHYDSEEHAQNLFLRHELLGFTLISWWDRNQGDVRRACNSTFLLEGGHTSEQMLAALAVHFPHVVANLKRAGVELVEVTCG